MHNLVDHFVDVHHHPLGYGVIMTGSHVTVYINRTPEGTPCMDGSGELQENHQATVAK
jgi:hypothetical protein